MLREFYLERLKAEVPTFLKVLEALPEQQMDYKPHERSPSARQRMWTIAGETATCVEVARNHHAEWKELPPPAKAQMLRQFEKAAKDLAGAVAKMDEASWNKPAEFYYQG